jgi:hypothetical protein
VAAGFKKRFPFSKAKKIVNSNNTSVSNGEFTDGLKMDRTPIVPGFRPDSGSFETIASPEEFFMRSGVRSANDGDKANQPFTPSGFIKVSPDGTIVVVREQG